MGNCRTNAGTATPSSCDSGVTVPAWGVPERFGWEPSSDTGVVEYSSWQLAEADVLLRYEYNHEDGFTDGLGAGQQVVSLLFADDDEGTNSEVVARDRQKVANAETGRWHSVFVEMIVPAGTYYRVSVFHPLLTIPQDSMLPGGVSKYQNNFATLVAMENQS